MTVVESVLKRAEGPLMTVEEVARVCGVSPKTVSSWCSAGILPSVRAGAAENGYRVPVSAVDQVLAEASEGRVEDMGPVARAIYRGGSVNSRYSHRVVPRGSALPVRRGTSDVELVRGAAGVIAASPRLDARELNSPLGVGTVNLSDVVRREDVASFIRPQAAATFLTPTPATDTLQPPDWAPIPAQGDTPVRARRLADFFSFVPMSGEVVRFAVETTRTDHAAETALGTAITDSEMVLEDAEAFAKAIVATTMTYRETLADRGELEALVGGRLRSAIRARLEAQLVAGDGLGENLTGILATDGITELDRDATNESRYDAIGRAISAVRLSFFDEPNGIGIHPSDLEVVLREENADGVRLVSGEERSSRTLHSLPWAATTAVPEGTVLVGAFDVGCTVRVRSGIDLTLSDSHSDFFVKRQVQLLSMLRVAFPVRVPAAFAAVTL